MNRTAALILAVQVLATRIFLLLLLSCSLFCNSAFSQTDNSQLENSLSGNKELPIKLGATLPLSGDIASYGYLIRDGIELALDDLRAEGFKVSVVYEDVPLPTQVALSAIKKLIYVDHINALAANFWNPAIPIMASEIMRNKIITFHTAAADDVILKSGELIFCTNTRIRDEAYHIAEFAHNQLNAKTASVLYIATNFGENYQKHFIKRFEELGGQIVSVDNSKLNDSDLRAQLLRVKTKAADFFFAAYFGTNLGMVLKQAGQIGIKQQTFGVYEAEDPSVIEVAGHHANGLRFFVAEAAKDKATFKRFREKFLAKYKYEPRNLASNSFDATHILVKALAACKLDAECTKERLHKVNNYDGASGIFSIDNDGAATKPFVLKGVQGGEFVYR